MKMSYRGLESQFIDDLDPYLGATSKMIPVPVAIEFNSDDAWQDFQDTNTDFEQQFVKTAFGELGI